MRPNYSADPRTVDFVTELLSVSVDDRRAMRLRAAIENGGLDWLRAVTFANAHFVTVAFSQALHRNGLWDYAPEDVRGYLADIYSLAKERVARQRAQALDAIEALNAAGVVPIMMKSSADILDGAIEAGISSDLDVLAPPGQDERAANALACAGFRRVTDGDAHSVGSFVREGDAGPIDLHHRLLDGERILPLSDVAMRVLSRSEGERRWSRLSPNDELAHLVLHDQVQSGFHLTGTIDLKNLLRLAELMLRFDGVADWLQLHQRMRQFGFGGALLSQVDAACRYFGAPRPDLPLTKIGGRFSR
ncbi:MAG: nucleotidyltransferase family protein, partial [Pseudomonadota bacterium]